MKRLLRSLAPLLLAAVLLPAAASAGDIAVVVHPDLQVADVPFVELKKILRGDRQFWPSKQSVTLLVRAPTSPERTVLLEKVYNMNEQQFKQYWIAKVFRAETSSGPKVVLSNEMALQLVKVLQGAVALIDVADVPTGAKVLKVDGKLPGEKGYPLQ